MSRHASAVRHRAPNAQSCRRYSLGRCDDHRSISVSDPRQLAKTQRSPPPLTRWELRRPLASEFDVTEVRISNSKFQPVDVISAIYVGDESTPSSG